MIFHCDGCNIDRDFNSEYGMLCIPKWGDGIRRYCKYCHSPSTHFPDTFFNGKPEINLADDEHTGQPRVFFSKGQKAAYLKEKGLMEAGDRYHGAPIQLTQAPPKVDSRQEVRAALQRVKEMGVDRRRQEYLKIVKEGRR